MATPLRQRALDAIGRARALAGATELLLTATRRLHHDCRNTRNTVLMQRFLRQMRRRASGLA
jgi:hypothetical protein